MTYRVGDNAVKSNFTARINAQRSRLSVLQERITTGKRINRPSDDPSGASAVIKLRTSQTEIEQFKRSAAYANQRLTGADDSLSSYETILERVRTLVAQGVSDTSTPEAKNALATEIDALRSRILNIANGKYGDDYLFGGSRQNAPPFDPVTAAPAATAATPQYLQIEPGANALAVGVTAETVFSDATATVFQDLTTASAALRGTGDPVADRASLNQTMSRLAVYRNQVSVAHAQVGASMNITDIAQSRLSDDFLSFEERIGAIENDDFAATAVELSETESALEATLQVAANTGKKTLFDYL
jgi:flagellar hook-associated protein 3 FlgL